MATVRLFANLREIAGATRVDVPGETVGGVIEAAGERFGKDFARGVAVSRVWVNGDEATHGQIVTESDEVVILPPVSGGSQPATVSLVDLIAFAPLGIAVIAVLAAMQTQEIWAAALVAIASLWALDLNSAFERRGRLFAPLAAAASAVAGGVSAHALGGSGYGLALAFAVVITLGWAVAFMPYRQVDVFAPNLIVSVLAALGVASLVLVNSDSAADPHATGIFLVAVITGSILGAVVARLPAIPYLDPIATTAISAVLASVAAALIWDAEVVDFMLVGLGIAVTLVAGSGLSSMLRTGRVSLTERPAGVLAVLDGIALAAAIYFPLVGVIL